MSSAGSTLSPVVAAIAAIDELLPSGLSGEVWRSGADELDQALARLRVIEARLAGLRIAMVRDADTRGLRERSSAPSTVAWLRDRYGVDLRDARAEVDLALCTRPGGPAEATGDALRNGRISEAHARTMLALLEALPAPLPAEVVAEAEQLLLEVAAYGDSRALRSAGRDIAEKLTPVSEDGPEPRQRELTNELHLDPYEPGWWRLSGLLDAEHAAAIQSAIDAMAVPGRPTAPAFAAARPTDAAATGSSDTGDEATRNNQGEGGPGEAADTERPFVDGHAAGTDDASGSAAWPPPEPPLEPTADTRGAGERRADALAELCAGAVCDGRVPTHGGLPATITVTMTLEELLDRLGGVLGDADRLSAADVRRLACDAGIIPAVLGGSSEILDLGRLTRTVPTGIRRALGLRDGGCVFPGCTQHPTGCDAHHIVHWAAGGRTELANLCLLCPHHHRRVHRQGWRLAVGPDGVSCSPPPSVDPRQQPRRHSRLLIRELSRPTYVRPDRR